MEIVNHNIIRKNKDAFSNAVKTIKGLSAISKKNKRLSIGINSTYVGSNFESICKLYEELKKIDVNYVSLNLIRGVTWESRPKEININEYKYLNSLKDELINSKKKDSTLMNSLMTSKGKLMTKMIADTVKEDRSMNSCYAGNLFGVIKDNGDVFACEQLGTPLGNLSSVDFDLSKIWFSEEGKNKDFQFQSMNAIVLMNAFLPVIYFLILNIIHFY